MVETVQLRFNDIQPQIIHPEMWECMKTCAHAGEITDHFPGTNRVRCLYGISKDRCSGNDMFSKLIDNRWYCWCKYYEEARVNA